MCMSQFLDGSDESIDGFGTSGPTCAEAHCRAVRVNASPWREHKLLAQDFDLLGGENGELLIGAAIYQKIDATASKSVANAQCLLHGMLRNREVEIVAEKRKKLYAQQSSLGEHSALLLDVIAKITHIE